MKKKSCQRTSTSQTFGNMTYLDFWQHDLFTMWMPQIQQI